MFILAHSPGCPSRHEPARSQGSLKQLSQREGDSVGKSLGPCYSGEGVSVHWALKASTLASLATSDRVTGGGEAGAGQAT